MTPAPLLRSCMDQPVVDHPQSVAQHDALRMEPPGCDQPRRQFRHSTAQAFRGRSDPAGHRPTWLRAKSEPRSDLPERPDRRASLQHWSWNLHNVCSIAFMETAQLDPVAAHLIAGYLDTQDYSLQFRDTYTTPPTLMTKVHHFRSIVQARLIEDDAYQLQPEWTDFGRVEFFDATTGDAYLLKSAGAVAIEKMKSDRAQLELMSAANLLKAADASALIYDFDRSGLTLWIAAALRRAKGTKVYVKGDPIHAGFWPYTYGSGPDDDRGVPFDQGGPDPFGDVGNLNESDEDEADAS